MAAEKYQQALDAYYCYAGDPMGCLQAATEDSPGFLMAHVLSAYLSLIGTNAEAAAAGVTAFEAAAALPGSERELGHVEALRRLLAGEIAGAARTLEAVTITEPRDVLALQVGQVLDFLLGDSRMLRDRIGRALPHWSRSMPDHHAVLGMLAFGLEETGHYDRAEDAGLEALSLERRNGWAQHAVAHVFEMQDRRAEGVAFMRADIDAWTRESFFQVHNWWHLALFHLGQGEAHEALKLFDGPIFQARSDMALDLVDASSMLWRLQLHGVDVGDRWAPVADIYEAKAMGGAYAFDDAHAMMAFVGAGRTEAQAELLQAQAAAVGDNVGMVRDVGLPILKALQAFGSGDYARVLDNLRPVRNIAARFGGSHAQRDLIDLTMIEAASRGGDQALHAALLAERHAARPLTRRRFDQAA
ncbi:tetratricopeptide repeat protein [Phenylobacterium sp.]|uniref:tetratricopeptide repeat protein n=1 Tax=Phenylobacterium sp. TaxID=1871053 RepID=UPI002736EE47|nr:tetratricopeptide repeat protein [Phenylobacterium sp.]MDP3659071.1 tetratricopeptide repeat protein [Phenylobacterium sp.]